MKRTLLDRAIGYLSPEWAMRRQYARATLDQIENLMGSKQGYSAGTYSRLNPYIAGGPLNENAIPRAQVSNLRDQSWKLYRDNPHARKILRSLESKVIGKNLSPRSRATRRNGDSFTQFRERAAKLWESVQSQIDYRGRPGRGGQSLTDICKTALRGTVLGGEVLTYYRKLTVDEQVRLGLTLPIQIQLIHADRLDESRIDDNIFFGIEVDQNDKRLAYHILDSHPADPRKSARYGASKRIKSTDITHLYISEDVDQFRGVPWFSAALLRMKDTDGYEYNELQAAAQAACVALGYRRSTGQSGFGLQGGTNDRLTDVNGNAITRMQPGMLIDLGSNGEIQSFNPQRPNANAAEFIQHMLRSTAAGVPGVKSTTLTGDYRNSSFSSERAADNDTWPEIEGVQDWFYGSFAQPLYEIVIETGVMAGYFDSVPHFNRVDFSERRAEYLKATWQGPVQRSINPEVDAKASRARKANGEESVYEAAYAAGKDLERILQDTQDFIKKCRAMQLPEEYILSCLGIEPNNAPLDIHGEEGSINGNTQKAAATSDNPRFAAFV